MFQYQYPMFGVTADVVMFRNVTKDSFEILLVKRRWQPYQHFYSLVGGFVNAENELIKDAALRETREETGIQLTDEHLHFVDYFDSPLRDPRQRTITVVHYTILENDEWVGAKAMDDALELKWVMSEDLEKLPIAFDHYEIILSAVKLIGIKL